MAKTATPSVEFLQVGEYGMTAAGPGRLVYFFQVASGSGQDDACIVPVEEERLQSMFSRASSHSPKSAAFNSILGEVDKAVKAGSALKEDIAAREVVREAQRKRQRTIAAKYSITDPAQNVGHRIDIRV